MSDAVSEQPINRDSYPPEGNVYTTNGTITATGEGAAGYKLYSRNSAGKIPTMIVGGLGYKFSGIIELINMAYGR